MAKKKARLRVTKVPLVVVKPALVKPILKPVIEPVVARLDEHETLLVAIKGALDVQFQRIAALQAQMDHLLAKMRGPS